MPSKGAAQSMVSGEPRRSFAGRRFGQGNLPAQLSPFIGRRHESAEVKRLLQASRLVTLTGTGGIGKTRLALHVAGQVARAFGDGVWLVDLTRLSGSAQPGPDTADADELGRWVMAELRLREPAVGSPMRQLTGYLAGRRTLLVLDNCEHVLPGCAILVEGLLRACAGLRVLVTGREPLAVGGEVLYAVPPLPLPTPDPHRPARLGELAGCESVALFLARAQAAVPTFVLAEENSEAVAELCRRLDGLPLGIELAAVWVRSLTPQQILLRLTDRFALLRRGVRTAPARQQTLRGCVEWSVDLCTRPERLLWARLSVFVGEFELDSVEGVCAGEALSADDVAHVLAGLVDKSIVKRTDAGDPRAEQARYRMLETIRDYGRRELAEIGEQTTMRRRHRDWYERLVAQAQREWISDRQMSWHTRLLREHPNLRAAIEFGLTEPDHAEAVLRMVISLPRLYWLSRGMFSEGLTWLERALAQHDRPSVLRARALLQAGWLAIWRGDTDGVQRFVDEGQGLAERLDDDATLAVAEYVRAQVALMYGDPSDAVEHADRALALLPVGSSAMATLRVHFLLALGPAAALTGDHERAARCFQETIQITEPRGEIANQANARLGLGMIAWRRGDPDQAGHHLAAALQTQQASRLQEGHTLCTGVDLLAWISAHRGQHRRAAILFGFADAARTRCGISLSGMVQPDHDAYERQVRDVLGDAGFAEAFRRGQALPLDDAIDYCLDLRREPGRVSAARDSASPLTRREHEIAGLVAAGRSNKEIATALVISTRTVESHVEHVLIKFGFTSRTQIAAWITAQRAQGAHGSHLPPDDRTPP
jgi:predicted ATPase/DNA-binding CsgD family transcriptional regulator